MTDMKNEQWIQARYNDICSSNPAEYGLISLKIKRFRIFNRMFGRETGDKLITRVYRAIASLLGEGDYAAHIQWGYFNLLVHMPRDYDGIFHYVIDLNAAVRDWQDEDGLGKVYCGMGVYLLEPRVDFRTAQYNADICRTECPESALRNSHFEVYGMTYHDANLQNYNMEDEFRPAMENGDFKLYLQPKVDLRTGEVYEAEALVRWIDPVRGMIPVCGFLPEFERSGLIGELDLYLFGQVCRAVARWLKVYGKKIKISVNLSSNMFNYRYFMDKYREVFEQISFPRECIEFELIENIVLNQVDQVKQVVAQIRECGFGCSLDDFGSGYSSFSVLTSTKLDTLKIDKSLFKNESDSREKILIRHILESAKELDMKVVAEGVETRGYVEFLKKLDCDFIQGYVFYRPMPAAEFEERFVRNGEAAEV